MFIEDETLVFISWVFIPAPDTSHFFVTTTDLLSLQPQADPRCIRAPRRPRPRPRPRAATATAEAAARTLASHTWPC
jgi:hypothetical protein